MNRDQQPEPQTWPSPPGWPDVVSLIVLAAIPLVVTLLLFAMPHGNAGRNPHRLGDWLTAQILLSGLGVFGLFRIVTWDLRQPEISDTKSGVANILGGAQSSLNPSMRIQSYAFLVAGTVMLFAATWGDAIISLVKGTAWIYARRSFEVGWQPMPAGSALAIWVLGGNALLGVRKQWATVVARMGIGMMACFPSVAMIVVQMHRLTRRHTSSVLWPTAAFLFATIALSLAAKLWVWSEFVRLVRSSSTRRGRGESAE